ncbi:MAG: rane protein of unknown function [Candidatus Saccharibacteria bacterium]|nr:rane protein of unknown function [Candidatus Saccharibacteria bacterium]
MSQTDTSTTTNRWGGFIELGAQQLIQVAIFGVGVGAGAWILTLLIRQVILNPLLCSDATSSACISAPDTAGAIAAVVVAIIGVLGLVRLSIYRPLIIVLAVAICLWGLNGWVAGLPWFEGLAWSVLLYALAYVTFSWLVRPRAFLPAIIIVIVVVVLARLLPTLG